jgi:glyoxylase-like metal-dependent hydrolase (beta-lactamase superfamily II)
LAGEIPSISSDIHQVVIDPPEHTFEQEATVGVGDRLVQLRYLGRGHTDTDIVLVVPDADVLFGGDLVEEGSPPSFGDSFPLEWPGAVERILPLVTGAVVPGHGAIGDRSFVEDQIAAFRRLAELARAVHSGSLDVDGAIEASPFGPRTPRNAFERGLAQLRGELD